MLDHFFPLLFPKGSESLKILDIRLREVGAKRPLNGTSKVNRQTDRRTDRRTDGQTDRHFNALKRIILTFNSSSIALPTICISYCCHNRVLYWVYTDPYCFIYWAIRENIAPAARPIQRIKPSNIVNQEGQYRKYKF